MWNKIKRFFYWGWKMRNSYDFDSGYILEVMLIKMRLIYKRLATDKRHTCSAHENTPLMRKFRTCIALLERMCGEDFEDVVRTDHYFKGRIKDYTLCGSTLRFEDHKYSLVRDKEIEELFWKLFTKHYKTWWN